MHRLPPKPGFVGGFNWRATIAGLLVLVAANLAATQYIASRFFYQPALGTPLAHLGRISIYQPWKWVIWGWFNCTSPDQRVRQPLFFGIMILTAGCIVSVVVFFALSASRSRKLMKNTQDLHGSAGWASNEDVKATGLLDRQGVFVGAWEQDNKLHYLRHDGPEHVLAFAPTRSGKGVGLVIPTLLSWPESAVIYDIKGENWAKTAGFRAACGHTCFKFSPVEDGSSSRFNPLEEIRLGTPREVSDAQNIAKIITHTGDDSPNERYWQEAAYSLLTGMILHACIEADAAGRVASLADLARLLTKPGESFRETLEDIVARSRHPVVREKAQEMLNKEDREFGSVLGTAKTALAVYSDPLVSANTAASDFRVADLVNHERPVSLYLVVPPSDTGRLRPLIRLIFTLIVNRLTEKMVFQGAEQQKNKHRLLLLIDEFPSLGRMDVFASALSFIGGFGVKAYLITQDICQIVDHYGRNESIVSNCHVRVAFAPNTMDTAELLSKMAGTTTVEKASYNFSGSRFSPVMGHVNASVDQIERPLMTPDEILRIKPPRKVKEAGVEKIVEPGQALIFVSGQRPILGTQMLYFMDPELNRRAQIAPPTNFVAISGGKTVPQLPADQTLNAISRPEEEAPTMHSEPGFVEQLQQSGFGEMENTHADESDRDSWLPFEETGDSILTFGASGGECQPRGNEEVEGQRWFVAGTDELAQPDVLRRTGDGRRRSGEGGEPVRGRSNRTTRVHAKGRKQAHDQ